MNGIFKLLSADTGSAWSFAYCFNLVIFASNVNFLENHYQSGCFNLFKINEKEILYETGYPP